jgi:hypothetical protein
MIDSLFNTIRHKAVMPFTIVAGLLLGLFLYAGFTGWKFFGKKTENWSPEGKHTRTHK